jgi:hypothetical protein
MADAKISQLPVATTPLAGTELVPVVQGGVTVQTTTGAILTGTVPSGTANGVLYLNGSKVVSSGTALTFDGSTLTASTASSVAGVFNRQSSNGQTLDIRLVGQSVGWLGSNGNGDFVQTATSGGLASAQFAWMLGASEQMRLDSTGLGIGTSSPSYKLDVAGTINSGASTATGYNLVFRTSGITTGRVQTALTNTSGDFWTGIEGSTAGATLTGSAAYSAFAGTFTNNPLYLVTNGVIRTTLDSSGNLGLGVTPSAWSGLSGGAFQTLGGGAIWSLGADDCWFSQNAYENSGRKYIQSFEASAYQQRSGTHRWFTAPSGTAGNAISFTQALTLDANRNLLLNGTAAPASGVGTFAIFNGTAPTGSVTDGCVLYTEDVSSSSELKVRDEAGNVTTLSPHNFELIPEGPSEDMAWSYYSERDGKRINVDMLKAIRLLEKLSGEQLVYEA